MKHFAIFIRLLKKFTYELEKAGCKVVEKWECEFLCEKKFTHDDNEKKKQFSFYSVGSS